MKRAVVLLSGGMDSVTLLHYLRQRMDVAEVYALSVVYGQKHAKELTMAQWQAAAVGVAGHRMLDLSGFAALTVGASALTDPGMVVPDLAGLTEAELTQPPTYVPNRNMVLLALASAYAESVGASDVFYGAQAQDEYGYWDCTREFVEQMNAVLKLNRRQPVTLHAPFVEMRKTAVLKIGLAMGVDYSHTWTCYRGADRPCGTCPSCVERAAAFGEEKTPDPLEE